MYGLVSSFRKRRLKLVLEGETIKSRYLSRFANLIICKQSRRYCFHSVRQGKDMSTCAYLFHCSVASAWQQPLKISDLFRKALNNIFSSGVFPERITSSKSWTNISPVAKLLQKKQVAFLLTAGANMEERRKKQKANNSRGIHIERKNSNTSGLPELEKLKEELVKKDVIKGHPKILTTREDEWIDL